MKWFDDGEFLPGSERRRERWGATPMLAGEVVPAVAMPNSKAPVVFPFLSWAVSAQFKYPPSALNFLASVESAAEAFFAREFANRGGVVFNGASARYLDGAELRTQAKHGMIRIDFVLTKGPARLAIEIDGFSFHSKHDQMSADYLRARRIAALGYTLVRFTAQEVFSDAAECWRQLDAILNAHAQKKVG